jgi:predicted SnoaL-like aldol condensation-catalyzing enzyme
MPLCGCRKTIQAPEIARQEETVMITTERNKQTATRLYEAFRRKDVDAFDALVAEDYAQHNPQAGSGRQALKEFIAAAGPLDVEIQRMVAEYDLVAVHGHLKTWDMAVMDFRFDDDGRIVEHWDVLQPVAATTVSGNDMFSQLR